MRFVAICFACLLPTQFASAAIHACKLADGTTTYQDTACIVIPKAKPKSAATKDVIPFGIETSWFDTPPVVPDRAVCTEAGCHCGMFSRKFKSGLSLAIADALYLDGSWHRLESTLTQLDLPDNNDMERADLRNARDESACNILMSQKILRLFGKQVLRDMRNEKRYAEDYGLDDPADCDAGDMRACEYTDLITTYKRILSDIKSLTRRSRNGDELESLGYGDLDLGAAHADEEPAQPSTPRTRPTSPLNF